MGARNAGMLGREERSGLGLICLRAGVEKSPSSMETKRFASPCSPFERKTSILVTVPEAKVSDEVNSRSQQKRIAALKGEPYPGRDEQKARELAWRDRIAGEFHLSGQCGSDGGTFNEVLESGYECCCYEAADLMLPLLARRALEEAKWWEHLSPDCDLPENKPCVYCKRIAALEQAAASKAEGGSKLSGLPLGMPLAYDEESDLPPEGRPAEKEPKG